MLSFHYLTSMHGKNLKVLCFKTAIWRTLTSSCPIVIFRLTSFRLVRHDRFFFSSLSSLFVCCLPRNAFTFVLHYLDLAILAKPMNISPSASDGMRSFFFAVRAAGTSEHAADLDHFEELTGYRLA